VYQKSDTKIQITITTVRHILSELNILLAANYHLSDVNVANFNRIHRSVSEFLLFFFGTQCSLLTLSF